MKDDLILFNTIVEELLKDEELNSVVQPIEAAKLFNEIDISLQEKPVVDETFKNTLKDLILKTPRTATNLFFNQLFGGRNSKAVLGDLLAVVLNNSMYTYKVAGAQVGVEKEIINKLCKIIGYNNGDGTIAAGGSLSNFTALIMARDKFNKTIKETGVTTRLAIYTSKESHYSITKNASFAGIGRQNVRYVNVNEKGEMLPEHLTLLIKNDLKNGFSPFFVNSTAATTVLGAFDPIIEIDKICKTFNLWHHVDGAYGGGVIFSKKYNFLLRGLSNVDSFSINAHKMLGTPLTCSIILTKHKKCLYDSFSADADYLYQTDGDDYNLGKISLQCGRRNDALKFWTLWKSVGTEGLEKIVDHQFFLADVARNYVKNNPDYHYYSFDNSLSVCFNYKNICPKKLCTLLYKKSVSMIGFGSFHQQNFIRMVTINAGNTEKDILNFFQKLEEFVAKNKKELLTNPLLATK